MSLAMDNILDEVSKYSLHDQEMILGILQKRLIDEKRDWPSIQGIQEIHTKKS